MRTGICEQCSSSQPLNSMFSIFGLSLCEPCADQRLGQWQRSDGLGAEVPPDSVRRLVDPTSCSSCGMDNGDTELPQPWGSSLCAECERKVRQRPFPLWLKVAACGLFVLVVGAFRSNLRFMQAYREIQAYKRALAKAQIEEAGASIIAAADHVPEVGRLKGLADTFRGIETFRKGKIKEAETLLRESRPFWPDPLRNQLELAVIQTEIFDASEAKDYRTMLRKAQHAALFMPREATAAYYLASAYACNYAETGTESHKEHALEWLAKARERTTPDQERDFATFEQRIQHRLATREIIDREEFVRRFPNGWRPEDRTAQHAKAEEKSP